MVTTASMDPAPGCARSLETADVDLLRELERVFAEELMSADADAEYGAAYGRSARRGWTVATATVPRGLLSGPRTHTNELTLSIWFTGLGLRFPKPVEDRLIVSLQ